MKSNRGSTLLAFVGLLACAAPLHANASPCNVPLQDLGIARLSQPPAANGNGAAAVLFDKAPRVVALSDDGPGAGRFRSGDLLVSLDGHPITSPAAAARYASLAAGEEVRVTVKRRDTLRGVTVVASDRCRQS